MGRAVSFLTMDKKGPKGQLWFHHPAMQARVSRSESALAAGRSTRTRTPEEAQLFLDVSLTDAQAGVQLDRPGIDARRQGEAPPLEFAGDPQVEVERESEENRDAAEQRVAEIP